MEARYQLALHRPRNLPDVRVEFLRECQRPTFAETAEYKLPMGPGKEIKGPSIRFMEAAARCMRNVLVERRIVYSDPSQIWFHVEVMDLETNMTYASQFSVPRVVERRSLRHDQVALESRTTSTGQVVHLVTPSEGEYFGKMGAYTSRIIREGLRRIIPGDLLEEGILTARETVKAADKSDPDAAKKRIADGFATFGVTVADLERVVLKKPFTATLTPADMEHLRTIIVSLKEGDLTVSELLRGTPDAGDAEPRGGVSNNALKDKLRGEEKS